MSTAVRAPVIETAPESPRSLRTPIVHFKAAVPALDAALRSIADNLAALRLDPVLHLKIAVAIVAPLMGGAGEPVPAPPPRNPRVQPKTASSRLPTVHGA